MPTLDIRVTRTRRVYTAREQIRRVFWMFGQWLVRLSPRPCFGWRRFVLRRFGAEVGPHVNIYPTTRIYFPWNLRVGEWSAIAEDVLIYNLGPVTIGKRVTISHRVHLCAGTHDYTRTDFPLIKPPMHIQDEAWIAADAFVGPGITIGHGAVVGARAVVTRNVPPWQIVAGNPARNIGRRTLNSPEQSTDRRVFSVLE